MSQSTSAKRGAKSAPRKSPKRAAATKEAAEAKVEEVEPKSVTLNGREYELPATLPESMIFDIVEIEAAEGTGNPIPIFRLVRGILGPEQFGILRNDLDTADGQEIGESMAELVREIFKTYGLAPGES